MIVQKLLADLSSRDIHVSIAGDRLRVAAPEGAVSAELRELLSQHKEELLRYLSQPSAPIPYAPSSGQRRLWFLHKVNPQSAEYNVLLGWRLSGRLDLAALGASIDEVVKRHESLRTRFEDVDGELIALVMPPSHVELRVLDRTGASENEWDDLVRGIMTDEARTPFDLMTGPLFRAVLVKLAEESHALLLAQHHAVTDGASIARVSSEVADLYGACASRRGAPTDAPAPQFREYARWEQQWLRSDDAQIKRAYWERQLAGMPSLQLRTAPPSVAEASARATSVSFELTDEVAELKAFSLRENSTLFMTLLAAYTGVLHRYSRQPDFGVGAILNNRLRWPDVTGFLANTVVLRCDFRGDPTFRDVLTRGYRVVTEAIEHQELPYEDIVKASRRKRTGLRDPLIQASIELGSGLVSAVAVEGMDWKPVVLSADGAVDGVAKFDLGLSMVELSGKFLCKVEFDPTLFTRDAIERFAGHFRRFLRSAVASPDVPIAELPLLTEAEEHRVLREWNDTETAFPREKCAHQLFEEQARRTPDAVAVELDDQRLTFGELNRRANQLAHYLVKRGVAADTLVGLCVERSLEMAIGVLGILKAGGAYVPLEPRYPPKRLEFIREDSCTALTITQAKWKRAGVAHAGDLVLEEIGEELGREPSHDPGRAVDPQSLVYVIYTSGSTGLPKGTLITHLGLVNYLSWAVGAYEAEKGTGAPVHSSLSFDLTVTALWVPWLVGRRAKLLAESSGVESLEAALAAREGFSLVKLTPAHLDVLHRRFADGGATGAARMLVVGGEALLPETIAGWRRASPDTGVIVNEYGPTETVVGCCVYFARRDETFAGVVPIGRPIANTQLYVLDDRGQPVPIGVAGELYIGGLGLARGYLNRPELTRERFVANPFSTDSGSRLYRTGDLARYRRDGNLEFLGRIDDQVKVRGYRIELGEIESALASHPNVTGCAVALREDAPGDKRLVAYVVTRLDPAPTVTELREHARGLLPEYMLPSAFVALQALPLTANGKVDRAALPAPERLRPELSEEFLAPRDAVEEALASIWCEVLRVDRVGVRDNFFEMGGDSILSIQLVSRAYKAGLRLTPAQVFEHQTIADLARAAHAAAPLEVAARPVEGDVAQTPIQRWFFERDQPEPHHFNQSLLVSLRPEVERVLVDAALQRVVAAHDAFRLRFARSDTGWDQRYASDPASIATATWDLARLDHGAQSAAIESRATALQASLSLGEGPLARAAWIDLGAQRGRRLLVVVHHLIVDGVSWRILLEDLGAVYEALTSGTEPAPLRRTASFQEWAAGLEAYATSRPLLAQSNYWRTQSRAAAARLPTDGDAADDDHARDAETMTKELSAPRTTALLQQVPRAYGTQINDALLTALTIALASWAGDDAIRIDLEGHGREDRAVGLDSSRTVGWFTSLYPVVLERQPGDVGATLRWVKETLRRVPDRGLGYGVAKYLTGDAELQVDEPSLVFNYLGQWDALRTALGDGVLTADGVGQVQSPKTRRRHSISVDSWIEEGRLRVRWTYAGGRYERATIDRVASELVRALEELIEHCLTDGVGGYTPSDFELARLDTSELEALLRRTKGGAVGERGQIEDIYPVSPTQEGMLFHALYAPDSSAYLEQVAFVAGGTLDVVALAEAWRHAVREHPALRTTFAWEGLRRPLQIVHCDVELPVAVHDWSDLSREAQKVALDDLLVQQKHEGFDLSNAPLLRLDVARLGASEHRVVLGFHHLLMDGWSMAQVFGQVFRAYDALVNARPLEHASGLRYRDYISWLGRQDHPRAESYWRGLLAGFGAPTPLWSNRVADGSRAPASGHVLAERPLGQEATDALTAMARKHGLTLAAIFQGAWALLLSRYGGEEDIVFGTVTSGRPSELAQVESAVGLFVNTLPIRITVGAKEPLVDWLRKVQARSVELREYEYSSLADVQAWSDVPAGTPLFESLFVYENYPMEASLLQGDGPFALRDVEAWETTSYPVNVAVLPRGRELSVRITYDATRFDEGTMSQVLEHYVQLLASMAERPLSALGELSMISERERHRMTVTWNDTTVSYPRGECLHELFEARAAQTPDAVAIEMNGASIRYGELDARANQLAHHLRSLGVGPEVRVGLSVERSIEMVVALLGIFKAGGAYVPLDPTYPSERLEYMLEDAGGPVLVTQRHLRDRVLPHGAHVVVIDDEATGLASQRTSKPASAVAPTNVAYVIYTSGSTGLPKGVIGTHEAILNRLHWMWDEFPFEPTEVGCHKTSLNFLDSVWEIFGPLLQGVRAVAIDSETSRDPFALVRVLAAEKVTRIVLVPSLLRAVIDAATALGESLPSLRYWTTSGEAIASELANRFAATFPRGTLINLYGASELAADSTCYVVPKVSPPGPMPIGRPIANTQVYVLDAAGKPAPLGVPGELYVGGLGLARGYLARPAMTAERFLPNEHGPGRLYRTGDRVRWRADGNLEYLGRVDQQVKIRGFRVELGEVEAALAKAPGVRSSLVVAREDSPGDKRLVGYVVPAQGAGVSASTLREALKSALPEFMVPSAFVLIDALPLTPSGKIDRNALPAPDYNREILARRYVAPSSSTELVVARIWSEVLGVAEIGVEDSFFELGGHSLLAMQAIARLHRAVGITIPLVALFEGPTVRALARVVDDSLRAEAPAFAAIPKIERTAELPLSFAQERLWFLDQYAPNSNFYNVAGALRLRGPLNVDALRSAFEAIVHRHAPLRTRFESRQGRATQLVDGCQRWEMPAIDLRRLAPADAEEEAIGLAEEESRRPFDLARGPLLRTSLFRVAEDESVLCVVVHHIVSDGWSFGVLARELGLLYGAFVSGRRAALPELPIEYVDFAQWQRSALSGESLDRDLAYWRERLEGVPALELATDRPRPKEQTFAGAELPVRIDRETTHLLRSLTRERQATLFMALLAGYQVLLGRHAGQSDVAVGTPIANRTRPELEGLIGFFVNTLVLRSDFSDDPSFASLLDRVRDATLGAYEHQDVPFEKLVDALQVERDVSRSPLFQAMFALQNAPFEGFTLAGLDAAALPLAAHYARFDLTLHLQEREGEIVGTFEYNTDLFDRATIERLAANYLTLLQAIVRDPGTRVRDLRLLTESEERQVVVEWNQTAADVATDFGLHELFERQAALTPDAIAVVCGDRSSTYRELEDRANDLARRLGDLGVGPEATVALLSDRSVEMIVGLLGILKSGGAYLPLDPEYPAERVAYMLEDSRARVVVVRGHLSARLPATEAAIVDLDAIDRDDRAPARATQVSSGSVAYLIYTSGSTGKPKGVAVTHRNAVHSTLARHAYYDDPVRRFLLISSFSFDSSVAGIFWTLSQGGALVLPKGDDVRNVAALAAIIAREAISHLLCTPSLLMQLLGDPSSGAWSSLGTAIVAGEACPAELVREARVRLPNVGVYNEYGPTEASVWSTAWRGVAWETPARIPIGKPIQNVQVYIVDDRLRPVPIGTPGELMIGGAGVARGYLYRPALTADRFVPNPFGEPGSRLYRTGDLARFLPDGDIEFLGRLDHQVKIRGYRIELGEIESALLAEDGVDDAAVIAREDRTGAPRLVAYVGSNERLVTSELRARLERTLPEHMIPAVFVFLEALPRSPNGKVDRNALPAPEIDRATLGSYAAPRTPTELTLSGLWSAVLGVESIGIDDNFFHLGGHSLLATQVMARLHEASGVAVPLRRLFGGPTIRQLARVVDEGAGTRAEAFERIPKADRHGELPLSFAQQRLWFLDQYEPGGLSYSIAGAVWIDGTLSADALRAAFEEILRRHEVLRTRIVTREGRAAQVIDPPTEWSLPTTDLRDLVAVEAESRALALAKEISRRPFDLARGPLLRTELVRTGDARHLLVIAMHHVVSDGWSMGVLVRELRALYAAAKTGRDAGLPMPPIQYADFASWQRSQLEGERLDRQLGYWRSKLAGAPVVDLPTDRPRPTMQTYAGATVPIVIGRATTRRLKELSARSECTLFMTLLGGFQALLRRYTSQGDISVGSPIANRTRPELEPLIGFFVNTLILRTDLSDNPTFTELLRRVRTTTLEAYEHQEVPFEKLVDALVVERDTSRTPLFQVMFALQNASFEEVGLADVTMTAVALHSDTAKFDLTVNVEELGEEIVGTIEFNTDLFDASTIERLRHHYVTLLEEVVHQPGRRIDELQLLTATEESQVLGEWNATHVEFPRDKCIHELFEQQVAKAPYGVALVYEGEQLTYGELNARANTLAQALLELNVEEEACVGLCVDRSFDMIVGMLAILKAGGAYVPIDSANPSERLELILRDAKIGVVVALPDVAASLDLPRDIAIVSPRQEARAKSRGVSLQVGVRRARPHGLAQVMYTSGSTGRPKGACLTHRNVARIAKNQTYVSLGSDEVWFHYASSTFDATTLEVWPALLNGARVVLNPPGFFELDDFADRLKRFGVTTLWITAGLFRQMVDERIDGLMGIRQIMSGGDVVSPWHVRKLLGVHPRVHFINGYGPTENTVFTSVFPITADVELDTEVPIGKLINNSQAYVLNDELVPVPLGVTGELYVAGEGLGRGYLDPVMTADRYFPNPFSDDAGARMYRTGDLVRWRADGNLMFVGRVDGQVKVRGIRIELGEIEAALSRCVGVRACVVIVREDRPGDKRIVGYVSGETSLTVEELRGDLKLRIPDYMMPSAFVLLETFPLTTRGKVDRRALPPPDAGRLEMGQAFVAPRSPDEQTLTEVWSQVLGVDRVGVHDNFFALGGDSILSIQIVARAAARGVRMTARDLFRYPTIAQLAPVASRKVDEASIDVSPIGPTELIPIQRWFFEQESPEPAHFNQAVMLEAADDLDLGHLEAALSAIALHHDALRARYHRTPAGWRQEIAPAGEKPSVARIALPGASDEELQAKATEIQRSLDLGQGPLLRASVIERGDGKPLLVLLVIHHLVVDGVSWRILLEDLQSAYDAARSGRSTALPAKTTSFRGWAARLTAYAQSEKLAVEREYWRGLVQADVPPLPVTGDGASNDGASAIVTIALRAERTAVLLQQVPRAYGTQINDALLAALVEALGDWSGHEAVRIDLEGHGREEEALGGADLSRTVGWFTSLFPVVLGRAPGDIGATLTGVKEALRATPNRGLGYGALRYSSGVDDPTLAQAGEIVFNYLGQVDAVSSSLRRFKFAKEGTGLSWSSRMRPTHGLCVNAVVQDGALNVEWTFVSDRYARDTVERLASGFIGALERIIEHCVSDGAGGYTPSDFELAKLTQSELDELLSRGNLRERGKVEDIYPLSPMQEGMLFHAVYAPDSGIYFEQMELKLRGALDAVTFSRAWDIAVRAHPALRASFAWDGLARPLQIIHPHVTTPFEQHDWTALSDADQARELEELRLRRKRAGFDLSRAPLLRVDIARSGDDEHRLLVAFHHLLMDGWSMSRFFADVFRGYAALTRGEPFAIESGVPYREYIAWLEAQDRGAAESFWRGAMKGFSRATPLWGDKADAGRASGAKSYAVRDRRLARSTTAALEALGRGHGLTLNTILQGTWALLLSRYSGEDDVVFGAVTAGRPTELAGIEAAVGLFINTLPIRAAVDARAPVLAWLGRLQEQSVELRRFEYSPLARVQTWSDVPAGEPLFESLYVFENYPVDESVSRSDAPLAIVDFHGWETTNYPLNLIVGPGHEVLIRLNYDTTRFDEATIDRMGEHLVQLLESIVQTPTRTVGELSMLTSGERALILVDWNETKRGFPDDRCIHQLFEENARRFPDAVALVHEGEQWTYAELNRRANQLAHRLRREGVGPDVIVGLCVERSQEAVLGILGILKAGGGYLPLDPDYPHERLAFMLEDSGVGLLVTQEKHARRFGASSAKTVCLDALRADLARESTEDPPCEATPQHLAYVIYTSGSTGKPKGAALEHRGLCNLASDQARFLRLGPGNRVLQFASLSFDASVWEIVIALTTGAALYVAPRERVFEGGGLQSLLRDWAIDTALLPPSVLPALVPSELPTLQTLLVGGESCPPALAAAWAIGRRLLNAYGPTEATVYASIVDCKDGVLPPVIGRPIGNARLYIVDEASQPVPAGVPGELLIGGIGVARGYWNRPELTAERFVRDPFSDDARARLYRTGDLARFRPDGTIEFLGRIDAQVKIRGFRIELGEIEARLAQHPHVRECVVVARQDQRGDRRLVAYLVSADGAEPSAADLRAHLQIALPEHMIPPAFVWLEAFPLTPNGKIDRKALPAPDGGGADAEREYAPPVTPEEAALAEIWAQVLHVERVGREDNFFELGGDSILSIHVVSRAAKRGIRLSARDVFLHKTIAALATVARSSAQSEVPQGPVIGAAELLPIQRWFFAAEWPELGHFNMGMMLESGPPLDRVALGSAVQALVEHHDALRMRFRRTEAGWSQEIAPIGERVAIDRVALDEGSEAEIHRRATELQSSLDVTSGPLLRVAVFERDGAGRAIVLLVIHHLVVDAVSLRVLAEDLETAYGQARDGKEIALPPKTASYQAWAARLKELGEAGHWSAQRAYWERAVRGAVGRIPVDDERGANTGATTEVHAVALSAAQTAALLKQVPKAFGAQANEALLTALVDALAGWTGSETFRIDLEGHGREDDAVGGMDLSRTTGWFTTLFPLVLERRPGDIGETLKDVKERLRSVPDRGLGYGVLRYMSDDAALEPSEPVAVSFNYLGQLGGAGGERRTFELSSLPSGDAASATMPRRHRLTINAWVKDGRLEVGWTYSERQYKRATIEAVARRFVDALQRLIEHCAKDGVGAYTPSDFELAKLSQGDLDALLERLGVGERRGIDDIYPLSPMQQGMLFHTLYAPKSGVYYQQTIATLDGPLDVGAFVGAWQQIIDAYPILRTSFAWDGLRRPLQIVHTSAAMPVDRHDWSQASAEESGRRVEALAVRRRSEGFDPSRAPLLRVDLARVGEREHRLVVSFHHLLMDGWSAARVFADVFAAYGRRVSGERFDCKQGLPYRAYVAWLEKQDEAEAERFWRGALKGFHAPTPLWGDKAPMQTPTEHKAALVVEKRVPRATTAAVEAFSRKHGITLSTITQSVWALLLSRYSGETDVVFGAVTSGRPSDLPAVETGVGLFINTLPVRVSVDAASPVVEWLGEVQRRNIELRRYEYNTLAQVQAWSQVRAGQPLFESLFVFENFPVDKTVERAEGALTTRDVHGWDTDSFPLSVAVVPGSELSLQINYDTSRFDEATIERLMEQFGRLLEEIVRAPRATVGSLSMLGAAERRRLLVEWNDTAADFALDRPMHRLFEDQVARRPDALAVRCDAEALTYRELNARANRIAWRLRESGVKRDDLVALLLDRSVDFLASVLAVFKAGGAYVPLDPNYPTERLHQILDGSRARVVIVDPRFAASVGNTDLPLETLAIGELTDERGGDEANLDTSDAPDSLAYVIFTSGSTGLPKGGMIEHRGMVNHMFANAKALSLTEHDVIAQSASQCFDISVWQFLVALILGGRTEIFADDIVRDPVRMLASVQERGVTVLEVVPSFMRMALDEVGRPGTHRITLAGLRWLMPTGEALPPSLCREWLTAFPGIPLVNAYGPTECSDDVTLCIITEPPAASLANMPIGRPIANMQAYVLDEQLQPLPIGVPGELFIGGIGVGRGYLHDPARTEQSFIANPFATDARARLYRTGDRARWLPDGNLEYLGRLDFQVKIRGHRIELGEIEAVLSTHPKVSSCVVVACDERLVAYVSGIAPGARELRDHVSGKLPDYMVPSVFVVLDALPLTPNGKVDRKALPAPELQPGDLERDYVAPTTPEQEAVASIWREVLGVERVGASDNFFELGGHSLLATQVVSRVRAAFELELPLRYLFEFSTVAALAEQIAALRWVGGRSVGPIDEVSGELEDGVL